MNKNFLRPFFSSSHFLLKNMNLKECLCVCRPNSPNYYYFYNNCVFKNDKYWSKLTLPLFYRISVDPTECTSQNTRKIGLLKKSVFVYFNRTFKLYKHVLGFHVLSSGKPWFQFQLCTAFFMHSIYIAFDLSRPIITLDLCSCFENASYASICLETHLQNNKYTWETRVR